MATSFASILERTKTTHPIHGGTYRYLPDKPDDSALLRKELSDVRQELAALRQEHERLKTSTPAKTTDGATTAAEEKLVVALAQTAEADKRATEAEKKLTSALSQTAEATRRATEAEANLATATTEAEEKLTERINTFAQEIEGMLDSIPTRRMTGGGFQQETILSVLGSTAEHGEPARIALEAMQETLKSVGKHEDLVTQWDRTLAELDKPTTPPPEQTGETATTYDVPTVVGLVPVVERLLARYETARTTRDAKEAMLARAEFESALLEATGVQYILNPMAWETTR